MKKIFWFVVCVVVIIVAAFFLSPNTAHRPSQNVACTMDAKICPDGTAVGRIGPNCEFQMCPTPTFIWDFKELGDVGANDAPRTEVSLRIGGRALSLGTYDGSCFVINDTSWKLLSGEQGGIICWFAGGGVELGVFKEGEKWTVKKGVLDEGDGETGGTRGDFQTILTL